ncbi:MAG: hypothetical protein KJP21_02575 [Bacteroidia bacterium]|nr:hypothetical protein [Bacteroidia bacterium]NNJ54957.1 hypothetical protein [Bacteroidia bacterium]
MKPKSLISFLALFLISSCSEVETPENVTGLRPIYGTLDDIKDLIQSKDPQPLKNVGKIYIKVDLLLINEAGAGVHIYDNTNKSDPKPLKFISIPGNVDVAIKGIYMYADLGNGLATIDISDLNNIVVTDYNNSYLNDLSQVEPPAHVLDLLNESNKIYYECPDPSKGYILAWEKVTMPKPQCYINR